VYENGLCSFGCSLSASYLPLLPLNWQITNRKVGGFNTWVLVPGPGQLDNPYGVFLWPVGNASFPYGLNVPADVPV
jgi:hypothetical protein